MTKPKTIICDLDGTLANCNHRKHFIEHAPKDWAVFDDFKKDWDAFDAALEADGIYINIEKLLFLLNTQGFHIVFITGRRGTTDTRDKTVRWLSNNTKLFGAQVHFRKPDDHRPNHTVKNDIIKKVKQHNDIVFALDDDTDVLNMYRENGIMAIRCQEGNMVEVL